MKRHALVIATAATLTLSACAAHPVNEKKLKDEGHYWQRSSTTSAIYQRGPKAQQMLHRDISRCVTEIRELERLGSIRHHMPAETEQGSYPPPNTPEGQLAGYETPEKEGYLYAEHLDYHDFESCMITKGWERVEHVPYDVGEEAREVYIETITGQKYRSRYGDNPKLFKEKTNDDFDHLND